MSKNQIATYPLVLMETLRKHKVMFFIFLFFFMFIILFLLDYFTTQAFKEGFWGGVLVEAHGMFLDIILFGILLTLYERFTEKKNEIDRLMEEIDDYRGWNEPEAMYRTVGCIRRLMRNGVKKINLENCYLKRANLKGMNFSNMELPFANLSETVLFSANFGNANLQRTDFSSADMRVCILDGADLTEANLYNADLRGTQFYGTKFIGTNLCGAIVQGIKLDKNTVFDAVHISNLYQFEIIKKSSGHDNLKIKKLNEKLDYYTIFSIDESNSLILN